MHILLLTRHYPPEVSGGARRPSLLTKALRQLGHRVTVVSPFTLEDQDSITVKDKAIDNGISNLNNSSPTLQAKSRFSSVKSVIRLWVYWPDDNIRWALRAVQTVKHKDIQPDWIMTTSPPESIHIAGQLLSKHLNVPWVAEMRDTWTEFPHRKILAKSRFRAAVEKWIARRTLGHANAITAVSEAVMSEARKYVHINTPECIIPHFSAPPPAPVKLDETALNLVHTGGFIKSDHRRELSPLLNALETVFKKQKKLVFHIAGPLTQEEHQMVNAAPFPVKWHGSINLNQSQALQAGADGLILYTASNSHALPGKYAEYVLTGKPIFYMGHGDWMSLVEDDSTLEPLISGAINLKKNTQITRKGGYTHIKAAKEILDFLNHAERG